MRIFGMMCVELYTIQTIKSVYVEYVTYASCHPIKSNIEKYTRDQNQLPSSGMKPHIFPIFVIESSVMFQKQVLSYSFL